MLKKLLFKKTIYVISIFIVIPNALYANDKEQYDPGKSSYNNSNNYYKLNSNIYSNNYKHPASINHSNYSANNTIINSTYNYGNLKNNSIYIPTKTIPLANSAKLDSYNKSYDSGKSSYNNSTYKPAFNAPGYSSATNVITPTIQNDFKQPSVKQTGDYKDQIPHHLNKVNVPDKNYEIDKSWIYTDASTKTVPSVTCATRPPIGGQVINWEPIVSNSQVVFLEDTHGDSDIENFVQNNMPVLAANGIRYLGLEAVPSDLQPQLDRWDDASKQKIRSHLASWKSAGTSDFSDSIIGLIESAKKQNILVIGIEHPNWENIKNRDDVNPYWADRISSYVDRSEGKVAVFCGGAHFGADRFNWDNLDSPPFVNLILEEKGIRTSSVYINTFNSNTTNSYMRPPSPEQYGWIMDIPTRDQNILLDKNKNIKSSSL